MLHYRANKSKVSACSVRKFDLITVDRFVLISSRPVVCCTILFPFHTTDHHICPSWYHMSASTSSISIVYYHVHVSNHINHTTYYDISNSLYHPLGYHMQLCTSTTSLKLYYRKNYHLSAPSRATSTTYYNTPSTSHFASHFTSHFTTSTYPHITFFQSENIPHARSLTLSLDLNHIVGL